MKLTAVMEKYIEFWGEEGTHWGIERNVARIHGLLYLTGQALDEHEIATTLALSHEQAMNGLNELRSWKLVKALPAAGDQPQHFMALKDPWESFYHLMEDRKRRELDPTLAFLRQCLYECQQDGETPQQVQQRIKAALEFLEILDSWYYQVKGLPKTVLLKLIKLGTKIKYFLGR